jgi:hypothetical protein
LEYDWNYSKDAAGDGRLAAVDRERIANVSERVAAHLDSLGADEIRQAPIETVARVTYSPPPLPLLVEKPHVVAEVRSSITQTEQEPALFTTT